MVEFNLSKKILESYGWTGKPPEDFARIRVIDVKEFIKRLKEDLKEFNIWDEPGIVDLIDKLAGEKLV
jgi:hypothetical protein